MPIDQHHNYFRQLSEEHRIILMLAQSLKYGISPYAGLPTTPEGKRSYAIDQHSLITEHFEREESVLIPHVMGKNEGLDELCQEIIEEHQVIQQLFEDIQNPYDLATQLNELGVQLINHIRKEEWVWFPEIKDALSEEELKLFSN